jgi:hypothetical protein
MLPSNLHPGLPSFLFLTGFIAEILYSNFFSTLRVTSPAHLILIDFITRILYSKMDGCRQLSTSFILRVDKYFCAEIL